MGNCLAVGVIGLTSRAFIADSENGLQHHYRLNDVAVGDEVSTCIDGMGKQKRKPVCEVNGTD